MATLELVGFPLSPFWKTHFVAQSAFVSPFRLSREVHL
jgi:hypothetical protein